MKPKETSGWPSFQTWRKIVVHPRWKTAQMIKSFSHLWWLHRAVWVGNVFASGEQLSASPTLPFFVLRKRKVRKMLLKSFQQVYIGSILSSRLVVELKGNILTLAKLVTQRHCHWWRGCKFSRYSTTLSLVTTRRGCNNFQDGKKKIWNRAPVHLCVRTNKLTKSFRSRLFAPSQGIGAPSPSLPTPIPLHPPLSNSPNPEPIQSFVLTKSAHHWQSGDMSKHSAQLSARRHLSWPGTAAMQQKQKLIFYIRHSHEQPKLHFLYWERKEVRRRREWKRKR